MIIKISLEIDLENNDLMEISKGLNPVHSTKKQAN